MSKLEISYTHLINWLIARGEIPNDYAIKLLNLEEYCRGYFLNNDNLPPKIKLLFINKQNEYIEWYDILIDIFNTLKKTEEGNKLNFLGQYQYEPLYNANKVIKNFDRYNLHIVSYYQLLHKYVNYYVPHLRKNIQHLNHEILECRDKEAESVRKLKRLRIELEQKLKDVQLALYNDVQEQVLLNAINYIKDAYNRSFQIIQSLYPCLQQVLDFYRKCQNMSDIYSVDTSLQYISHASKYSLSPFTLASPLNNNINSNLYYKSFDIIGIKTDGAESFDDASENNILVYNGIIQLENDEYNMLFNTFLGNSLCRNLLLSDINELCIFIRVRLHQLSLSSNGNIVTNNVQADYGDPPDYTEHKYKDIEFKLNELIMLLSGKQTVNMQTLLKNRQKLTETVQNDIKLWNSCFNEVNEQSSIKYQTKIHETNLENLKNELDNVKANVHDIKAKLQNGVSKIVKNDVFIFGEFDNI